MTTSALFLVLSAGLMHAIWNLLTKRASHPVPALFAALAFGALLGIPPFVYLILQNPIDVSGWGWIVLTGFLHALYYGLLSHAYQRGGDLSVVYPIARGTSPLLVMIAAMVSLNEIPSPLGVVGIVLVVTGLFAINLSQVSVEGLRAMLLSMRNGPVVLAFLTGLTTATYSLVDKVALTRTGMNPWTYLLGCYLVTSVWLSPMTFRFLKSNREFIASHRPPLILIGILSPLAYGLILVAFTTASKVSYIVASRECSILFATLLGTFVLKEADFRRRLTGAIIITFGIGLLAVAR
ncbi:MAG: EamA family transporter [Planctomycetota bacterium]|nr:EamA family transporter [Planctomycetota bacterium]MDA1140064.1 EamA family transporter [Planctomycetota bacterium]